MIKRTNQKFFRDNNKLCITFGSDENHVYLSMDNDIHINNCKHIAAKVNLSKKSAIKFSKDHEDEILSFLYHKSTKVLITGGKDKSFCVYNTCTMKLIQRIVVGKGEIHSLYFKSNILYVGAIQFISLYALDINLDNYDENQIKLINHNEVSDQTVKFTTITETGKNNFWIGGHCSNKIFNLLIKKINKRTISKDNN